MKIIVCLFLFWGVLHSQNLRLPGNLSPAPAYTQVYFQGDSNGYLIRHALISGQSKSDTLGHFISLPWLSSIYKTYQTAGNDEAYAALFQKRRMRSSQTRIRTILPVPTDVLSAQVQLTWHAYPETQKYYVYLTDRFSHILMRKSTRDTSFTLNLNEYNINRGVCYFWFVEPDTMNDARSDEICLTWITEEVGIFVREEIEKINLVPGLDESGKSLMKAGVYEQHKLYMDALREYKNASTAQPDSEYLKRMYAMFLVRIGVIKNAREVWN